MRQSSRRDFIVKSIALGLAMGTSLESVGQPATKSEKKLPSLKGKKILFTYGGWEGHEPEKFVKYLVPWLKQEGAQVLLHSNLDPYTDKVLMDTIDLVLQIFTMSKISEEQERGLLEAIQRNGTGMAGWHGGMCDAFRANPNYQYMTGGQWVAHPGGVIDYDVKIVDFEDEVTRGLENFPMHSEQYYMHIDPNVKVLATTRFNGEINSWINGCVIPVAWKKMFGKGRVFYTSLGHNLDHVTAQPAAIEMLQRGIKWASEGKYQLAEPWTNPVYG